MRDTLVPGLAALERVAVDRERTIDFLGEALRVYSTPSMISDVEYATLRLIAAHLDDGESSVGVHVHLDHLAATPLGRTVEIRLRVTAVQGRRVTVEAQVDDGLELVGRGTHSRQVIDVARHLVRLREKVGRYPVAGR